MDVFPSMVFHPAMPAGFFAPSVFGHGYFYRGQVEDLAGIKSLGLLWQGMATAIAIGDIMKDHLIWSIAHFQFLAFASFLPARLAFGLPTKALGFSKRVLGRWDAAVATIFWVFVFF